MWKPLAETCRRIGKEPRALEGPMQRYLALLLEWNERMNLTAVRDPAEVVVRHFCDSLEALAVWRPEAGQRVVDVGSGAGFPGVPIAAACPEIRLTIIESRAKPVAFLNALLADLELPNVDLRPMRAEEAGRERGLRESFQVGLARALAKPPVACEYVLPLVERGGRFLLWASRHFGASEIEGCLSSLGGRVAAVIPVRVPGAEHDRAIVDIRKVEGTPDAYPRPIGRAKKRPQVRRPPGNPPADDESS